MSLHSIFAPQSIKMTCFPVIVGNNGASAGLLIPRILPAISVAPTKTAPVDPAEIKPSHVSSSLSLLIDFTNELSGLLLTASVGASSLDITSGASTISIFSLIFESFNELK